MSKVKALERHLDKLFFESVKKNPGMKKVLTEGDSWFSLPFNRTSMLTRLRKKPGFVYRNLAHHGDEIVSMMSGQQRETLKRTLYLLAEKECSIDILLISGGGNDIVGPNIAPLLLDKEKTGFSGIDLVPPQTLQHRLKQITLAYQELLIIRNQYQRVTGKNFKILTHQYDLAFPCDKGYQLLGFTASGPWMWKHMMDMKITDPNEMKIISDFLLSSFKELLDKIEQQNEDFFVAKTQGILKDKKYWKDEIHPNKEGFELIACEVYKNLLTF